MPSFLALVPSFKTVNSDPMNAVNTLLLFPEEAAAVALRGLVIKAIRVLISLGAVAKTKPTPYDRMQTTKADTSSGEIWIGSRCLLCLWDEEGCVFEEEEEEGEEEEGRFVGEDSCGGEAAEAAWFCGEGDSVSAGCFCVCV